jgi:hypothetical protein
MALAHSRASRREGIRAREYLDRASTIPGGPVAFWARTVKLLKMRVFSGRNAEIP